jgi:large subunit ribosomal protein L10
MTKTQKTSIIESLSAEFAASQGIAVAGYRAVTVKELEAMRNEARANGMKVKVVKNTLAAIALEKAKIEGLELKDTNIVVWGADQLDVCKLIAKFADNFKDRLVVKAAYLDGKAVDAATVVAMSKLPSKNELIGMLLSVWTAPARMFATGLDELRKQKESAA